MIRFLIRKGKYIENFLKNIDNRIDCSNINFSMIEKKAEYIGLVLGKLSSLVKTFTSNFSTPHSFGFRIIP